MPETRDEGRVGHVLARYLRRSETFIYTQLRSLQRFQPVVLTGRVDKLAEFPFSPIRELSEQGRAFVEWEHDAQAVARVLEDVYAEALGSVSS